MIIAITVVVIIILLLLIILINNIRNNITRSLVIFGINKIDVSYCLSSIISALLSKSHFQSKTYSFVH